MSCGLTTQQTVAIENPCLEAEQCMDQRYRIVRDGGPYGLKHRWLSIMLTVNIGME